VSLLIDGTERETAEANEGPALVQHKGGKAGAPTPSERRELYLAELRKGGPAPGWMARQARAWGLIKSQVTMEMAAARAVFDADHTPETAHRQAKEQVRQAIEATDAAEQVAREIDNPAKRADALLKVARARAQNAAALAALYRKGGGLAQELAGAVSASLSDALLNGGKK
jgi:hypothetical protein